MPLPTVIHTCAGVPRIWAYTFINSFSNTHTNTPVLLPLSPLLLLLLLLTGGAAATAVLLSTAGLLLLTGAHLLPLSLTLSTSCEKEGGTVSDTQTCV